MPSPAAFRVLLTFLVFLFPLALYCLVLGGINRRERPLLVRGAWDFAGILAGLSGILLWTAPMMLVQLSQRNAAENLAAGTPRSFEDLWSRWWLVWACYYGFLSAGSAMLLFLRSSVTAIYNVDVDQVPRILMQTLQQLGLDIAQNQEHQFLIAPAKSPGSDGPPTFSAAVEIDTFPSLCHATLHWYTSEPRLRNEIERTLQKQLAGARAVDNPASIWFLGASTLFFCAIILAVVFYLIAPLFPRRW